VVDAYVALYRQLLENPGRVVLEDLEAKHRSIGSSLHRPSVSGCVNIGAFVYSAERLPVCLPSVKRILIAPTEEVLIESGCGGILGWGRVDARRRRRRAHYDGRYDLAVFVTSISDFDDLVPALCAYQIEWNEMHRRLRSSALGQAISEGRVLPSDAAEAIRRIFDVDTKDWEIFLHLWPESWDARLKMISEAPKKITIERLPLRDGDFEGAAAAWLDSVLEHFSDCGWETRPVYVVSSNPHSFANLVSGYALRHRDEIFSDTLEGMTGADDYLRRHWRRLSPEDESLRIDFLYHALRIFFERHPGRIPEMIAEEEAAGIRRFVSDYLLHLEAQIIDLREIDPHRLDPGLRGCPRPVPGAFVRPRLTPEWKCGNGIIFNIDYPLGYSAHFVMKRILARLKTVAGVFVLGKSAAMIGRLGDILIPVEVRDEHSNRMYRFRNFFSARTLVPYLSESAVFDCQRTLTVRGTFLHSRDTVREYRGDDYTGIEMEAGPYLSAIDGHLSAGAVRGAVVDLPPAFPVGILHYTSDTPYNLRASLLSHHMGLRGLEATYACSRAVLDSILSLNARNLPKL
jgi:hypothetical protein